MNRAPKTIEEAQALPMAPFTDEGDLSLMPVDWDHVVVFRDTNGAPREVAFTDGRWCKRSLVV